MAEDVKKQKTVTDEQIVTVNKFPRRSFLTATGALLAGAVAVAAGARASAQQDPDTKKPAEKKGSDPDSKKGSDPDKKKKMSTKAKSGKKKAPAKKAADPDKKPTDPDGYRR